MDVAASAQSGWLKFMALVLGVAVIGLPVNNLADYALLVAMAVAIFSGEIRLQSGAWLGAGAIVAVALLGQAWLAPPRIEEGQRLLPSGAGAETASRRLSLCEGRIDREYPVGALRARSPAVGRTAACRIVACVFARRIFLQNVARGDRDRFLRSVARLGLINEIKYNWYTAARRPSCRRPALLDGLSWHLAVPWFGMIRLPAAMVGGSCAGAATCCGKVPASLRAVAWRWLPRHRAGRRQAARGRHRHQPDAGDAADAAVAGGGCNSPARR